MANTKLVHDVVVKDPVNDECLVPKIRVVGFCDIVGNSFCAAEEDGPAEIRSVKVERLFPVSKSA